MIVRFFDNIPFVDHVEKTVPPMWELEKSIDAELQRTVYVVLVESNVPTSSVVITNVITDWFNEQFGPRMY